MKSLCGEPGCDCGYTIDQLIKALEAVVNEADFPADVKRIYAIRQARAAIAEARKES